MLRWSEIKKSRNTFKYLAMWFILSDGLTTITSTAIFFGKISLTISPSALILIDVLTPTSGTVAPLLWPKLQAQFGWTNFKGPVILAVMTSAIPAYGFLGFAFQGRVRFGGLTTQEEMFELAVLRGYVRAVYLELLPPGEEARWYGFCSLTDKASLFLGLLIVGRIADMTGNIRYAFFFLVVMVWLATVMMLMSVDVERGREDTRVYDYQSSQLVLMGNGV